MAATKRIKAETQAPLNLRPRATALAVSAALLPWGSAHALPGDPLTTVGTVVHSQPTSHTMRIDVTTQHAATSYRGGFSIAAPETVNIHQLGRNSVFLVRDISGNPTNIFGTLTANGQVFLSNSNGVLFGRTASVEVGALFATTLSITDENFKNGRYQWSREGTAGSVVNEGRIVTTNGYTALVGPQVRNDGIIVARAGTVALAAADRVSLDLVGDGLISINVEQAVVNASVVNTGSIEADGGRVFLSARSANALLDTVINNSGIIRANSLVERNGEIVLDGGSAGVVAVSGNGRLEAAGADAGTTGGTVKVLGKYVGLFDKARIDASGDAGGGTVLIGGNYQGAGPEANASMTYVGTKARIMADALRSGNGGTIIVWADGTTRFYGTGSVRGGAASGNGGFAEVSGNGHLDFQGSVDRRAPNGKAGMLLLDPTDLTIVAGTASTNVTTVTPFEPATASGSTIGWDEIDAALGGGDVSVRTTTGFDAGEAGNITILGAGTLNNGNNLSIIAQGDLVQSTGATITRTVAGGLNLTAATGNVALNDDITLTSSALTVASSTFSQAAGTIDAGGLLTINVSGASSQAAGAVITGAGGLTKAGAGTLTLSGTNTYTGATTVSAGNLTLQGGAAIADAGVVALNGGTLEIDAAETIGRLSGAGGTSVVLDATLTFGDATDTTIAATISGSAGLTKQGASTVTLTGNNTYAGTTAIDVGVLNIQHANALGATAGGTTVASGAALELQGSIAVGAEALTITGAGPAGGALRNVSGNNSFGGVITLAGTARINSDANLLTLTGGISGAQNLTVGGAGDTTQSGAIATTTGTLTKDGAGTLTLSGTNTYTGTTTISAGNLTLQGGAAI
ncbi:MAG TPA: autotransporter-associated beta strand repeat-containing protein, partial [Burkholderiales bacterium]